jgi:hypothetical protein
MENGIEVYKAISKVQGELAQIGIGKNKKNQQQGYNFRGIDDVYDALAPILAKHKLCVLPRAIARSCVERQTQKGNPLFSVTVECEFDLVSSEDGSRHIIRTFGEAMDSADKATNKAMSAAYKYAAFQTFCIPVDVEDADAVTPSVKPLTFPETRQAPEPDVPDFTSGQIVKALKGQLSAKMKQSGIDKEEQKKFYLYCMDGREESVDMVQKILNRYDEYLEKWREFQGDYISV